MAGEEVIHVGQIGGGAAEHAQVAAPSHTLVALRTVGGDADEVGQHRPFDVFPEAVHQRIAALVVRREVLYRTDYKALHIGGSGCCRDAGNLEIAIAVLREMRLEELLGCAGCDIDVLGHRAADVLEHQHSLVALVLGHIRVEDLRVAETKLLAFLQTPEGDAGDAGEVLAHIVHEYARTDLGDALRGQDRKNARRRVRLPDKLPVVVLVRARSRLSEGRV